MIKILPSLASANQLSLAQEIRKIEGTPYLHLDIEDGNFLPNITFGMKTIIAACQLADFQYDAHLLVNDPLNYIDPLYNCGIAKIAFHIEAESYPLRILNKIRKLGMKAGLALNFKTPIDEVLPFVNAIDYIIIMTAEPDDQKEQFNPLMLTKINYARKVLPCSIEIWVDGGLNESTLQHVIQSGADTAILGRTIWNHEQPRQLIQTLSEL